MKNLKINWICEAPTHYNDFLFNAYSEKASGETRLEVHYMLAGVKSHPWKNPPQRHYRYRHYTRKFGFDWLLIKKAWQAKKETIFIIGGWSDFTAMFVMMILSLRSRKFIIWTDTPSKVGKRNGLSFVLRKRWIGFILRRAAFVMGTGKMALTRLSDMGCDNSKLINMPYFTDNELFHPSDHKKRGGELVILSSGRLINEKKGFDLVIRALGSIRAQYPTLDFKYKIAGVGSDLEVLKGLVAEFNLEEQVVFEGWLEYKELAEFYRGGDIFAHPALYEPYGVTIIEAMASGLAIVGSRDTGAVVDRIIDGENGFICETNDLKQLEDQLRHLLMDKNAVDKFKAEARNTALSWPLSEGIEIINRTLSICVE